MSTPVKEAERPAKVTLGEFLLAGQWVDFPGLGKNFVFIFTSARARSDFWRKWKGVTVILPGGKEVILLKSTNSKKESAFLLTMRGGADVAAIRNVIKRKLQGMCTGHPAIGIWHCAHDVHGIDCTVEDVTEVAEQMKAEGILQMCREGGEQYRICYQFADPNMRRDSLNRQIEDGNIQWT